MKHFFFSTSHSFLLQLSIYQTYRPKHSINSQTHEFIPIINSGRRTGFNGLIICLTSLGDLIDDVLKTNQLEFLLTYKISQDHLEMFFSAIRSCGGFCDNPTASQFEAAYKRLLIHNEIVTSSQANCISQDSTEILSTTSSSKKKNSVSNSLDLICSAGTDEDETMSMFLALQRFPHSSYLMDVTQYISRAVTKQLIKIINCPECVKVLSETNSTPMPFIDIKTRGKLNKPTNDVTELCRIAENVFRTQPSIYKTIGATNIRETFIMKSFSKININKYFLNLSEHIYNQDLINNHLIQIIKEIFKTYFNIRIHYFNQSSIQPRDRIRSHFTKLVHFRHQ